MASKPSIEEKYVYTYANESIKHKHWAAGSSDPVDTYDYYFGEDLKPVLKSVQFAPAFLKMIDEPIVNALDQFIEKYNTPDQVTRVAINVAENGKIRIYNNGAGIPVQVHKKASEALNREVWLPELIFGELFQGSNRRKSADSITGGTNGIGSKVTNCFSSEFTLETVGVNADGIQMLYIQKWRDSMGARDAPMMTTANNMAIPLEKRAPHTTLSFMPDYAHFKCDFAANTQNIMDLIRTRCVYAAAYARYSAAIAGKRQQISIYFNDRELPFNSMQDIARALFPTANLLTTQIVPDTTHPPYNYTWEVTVAVVNTEDLKIPNHISNVNGIVVRDGKHIKWITSQIIDTIKEKLGKELGDIKFNNSYITNNIFLLLNTQIPSPAWNAQVKDVLATDVEHFKHYKLPAKFCTALTSATKQIVLDSIYNEQSKRRKGERKVNISADKYKPAQRAGTKESRKCKLLLVEGDSAMTRICQGLTSNSALGYTYFGVMSTGGVIMNVRDHVSSIATSQGDTCYREDKKLLENKFMQQFMLIVGLKIKHKYNPKSATYHREIDDLNYGGIIGCVDQDLDGIGNIFGLILSMFELFFPELLKAGFVERFATPIIRAYPRTSGRVYEFYSAQEYEHWATSADIAKYKVNYYKGLGTHSDVETVNMFKKFGSKLYKYYLDEKSHELFIVYYGDDPKLRKIALARPLRKLADEVITHQEQTMTISASDHLEVETAAFQKDNNERHLDHAVDGFNQSGKMIYDGLRKAFAASNKPQKVAQLAGYISLHENYHHGEASLAQSITGKGFVAVGGKQLPELLPKSNFGSRLGGGKDASQPRYIWAKFNTKCMDLIFPSEDYPLLKFTFDEGERCAPEYFVPTIPMAILESTHLPGHGWALKKWARDVFAVIANVRTMIKYGADIPLPRAPPAIHGWHGEIKQIAGDDYSFGAYYYNKSTNEIHISELPLRIWTNDYLQWLQTLTVGFVKEVKESAKSKKQTKPARPQLIAHIIDKSSDRAVSIDIKLIDGAMNIIEHQYGDLFIDPIEDYLKLRKRLDSNLNMIGVDGSVIKFDTYEEIMKYWFPIRRDLYAVRLERQRIIIELKIKYYENCIKYAYESQKFQVHGVQLKKMREIISEVGGYDKMHISMPEIINAGFMRNDEIIENILGSADASYDYLLNLSDAKKSHDNIEDMQERIGELRDDLEGIKAQLADKRFPGAEVWLAELAQLEIQIKFGIDTNWQFGEDKKYKFE